MYLKFFKLHIFSLEENNNNDIIIWEMVNISLPLINRLVIKDQD